MVLVRTFLISDCCSFSFNEIRAQARSQKKDCCSFRIIVFCSKQNKKFGFYPRLMEAFLLHSKCTFEAVQDPGDLGSAAAALQVHGDNQDCHLQIKQTCVGKQS